MAITPETFQIDVQAAEQIRLAGGGNVTILMELEPMSGG